MKDHSRFVLSFMHRHSIQLSQKGFEDWRQVVAGTYTHKTLPLGPMREGITNGVVGWFVTAQDTACIDAEGIIFTTRVLELHMTNLNVKLDNPFFYHSPKKACAKKVNNEKTQKTLSKKIQKIFDELL